MSNSKEQFLKDGETTTPDSPANARCKVIDASVGAATVALSHYPSIHAQALMPLVGAHVEGIYADRRATQLGVAARAVDAEVQTTADVEMTNDRYVDQLAEDTAADVQLATVTEIAPAVSAALEATVDTSEFNQPQAA